MATEIGFDDGGSAEGLVYIATHENAACNGAAPERDIARQLAASSGPNRDYLIDLANALRDLGKDDRMCSRSRYLQEMD